MNYPMRFAATYYYDTRKPGIDLPISLRSGNQQKRLDAKVDTGASHCIFERKHGERLGFDIETGTAQFFGTATGSFLAYGHEAALTVLGIETTALVFFAADEYFTRNILGRIGWLRSRAPGID